MLQYPQNGGIAVRRLLKFCRYQLLIGLVAASLAMSSRAGADPLTYDAVVAEIVAISEKNNNIADRTLAYQVALQVLEPGSNLATFENVILNLVDTSKALPFHSKGRFQAYLSAAYAHIKAGNPQALRKYLEAAELIALTMPDDEYWEECFGDVCNGIDNVEALDRIANAYLRNDDFRTARRLLHLEYEMLVNSILDTDDNSDRTVPIVYYLIRDFVRAKDLDFALELAEQQMDTVAVQRNTSTYTYTYNYALSGMLLTHLARGDHSEIWFERLLDHINSQNEFRTKVLLTDSLVRTTLEFGTIEQAKTIVSVMQNLLQSDKPEVRNTYDKYRLANHLIAVGNQRSARQIARQLHSLFSDIIEENVSEMLERPDAWDLNLLINLHLNLGDTGSALEALDWAEAIHTYQLLESRRAIGIHFIEAGQLEYANTLIELIRADGEAYFVPWYRDRGPNLGQKAVLTELLARLSTAHRENGDSLSAEFILEEAYNISLERITAQQKVWSLAKVANALN